MRDSLSLILAAAISAQTSSSRTKISPIDRFLVLGVAALFLWGTLGRRVELPEQSPWLDAGLGVLFAIWVLGLVTAQRAPAIPWLFGLLVLGILGYGWISVFNAEWTHVWGRGFHPAVHTLGISWLPGSKDQDASRSAMIHFTAIFGGVLVVVDLARSRRLRRQLLGWLALTGLAVAMAGVYQKASGTVMLWNYDKPIEAKTFFAAFDYHGNSATFLNLCWPASFLLWLRALSSEERAPLRLALWSCSTLFTLAAVFANTSKVGHVMAVVIVVILLIAYRSQIRSAFSGRAVGSTAVVGVILVVAAGALFISLSAEISLGRWEAFDQSAEARLDSYKTCWEGILPNSGITGYGPGTFHTAFVDFQASGEEAAISFTYRAHQDYLQLMIEWGYVGAGIWAVLLGGALLRRNKTDDRDFYASGLKIMLFGVLAHAAVDFPFQVPALQWPILALTGILWAKT